MLTLAAADTLGAKASLSGQVALTIYGMELNAGNEVYKLLYQGVLTDVAAEVYSPPASTEGFVKSIHAVNLGAAGQAFRLFANGLLAANSITPDIELGEGGWAVYDENGWQIYGSAVALASVETDNGPTLLVVDTAQRRLLEAMSIRLDEMADARNQVMHGPTG
jgi:hypothetical protein